MNYIVTDDPKIEDVKEVIDGLVEFNELFIGGVKTIDVACFSYDVEGVKTGGIVGQVWGRWLTIKCLWVSKESRRSGMDCNLLAKLEELAISKGCMFSLLDTYSFQARPFYEKYGYECQMTLKNNPISTRRHYLTKSLTYAGS